MGNNKHLKENYGSGNEPKWPGINKKKKPLHFLKIIEQKKKKDRILNRKN